MDTNALAEFERDVEAKRQKLLREIEIARLLPTNGVRVEWLGENGWDSKGQPNTPTMKTCDVLPHIIYDRTAYKAAEHVGYKAPDSMKWKNGQGEHVSSKYRAEFLRLYARAVLAAFEPMIVDTLAIKSQRYATSHGFPAGFDYQALRDYEDAHELGSGQAVVSVGSSTNYGGHNSRLIVHADVPGIGITAVDLADVPGAHRLAPRAHGVSHYGANGPVSSVKSWELPQVANCASITKGSGGDPQRLHCDVSYLFYTVEDALQALGIGAEPLPPDER